MKWIKRILVALAILVTIIALFVTYAFWENRPVKREYVEPFSFPKPEVLDKPFIIKREIYGDSEIFDQARIQFVWRGPNRENAEIWSVKIDGSDLRLAADAQLLYQGDEELGMHTHSTPMRSPNNRYILVNMRKNDSALHIIDLKEGTNTKIHDTDTNVTIRYPWVSDSQSFFYKRWTDATLSRYYLKEGRVEAIRKSTNNEYFVQQTAEIISEFDENEFVQWDFKGNELSRTYLSENVHAKNHSVSPDGSHFVFRNYEGVYLVKVDSIKNKKKIMRSYPILTWNGDGFIQGSAIYIYFYSFKSMVDERRFIKYGGDQYNNRAGFQMSSFSIFNEVSANGE